MNNRSMKYVAAYLGLIGSIIVSSLSAQVKLPQIDDSYFASSHIQLLMDGQKEIGIITKEYVVEGSVGAVKYLLYLPKADRQVDLAKGYDTKATGYLIFDPATGKAVSTYTNVSWDGQMYIDAQGLVQYQAIAGARVATLKPFLLVDKRGSETDTYPLLKIGNAVWLRDNLRATAFRDGTAITTGLTKKQWEDTKSAAVTYYDSNTANRLTMGGLYNWYAAVDERGLAPTGWKIPARTDWDALIKLLDTEGFMPNPDDESALSYAAGKWLKSISGWTVPVSGQEKDLKPGTNLSMMDMRPHGSTSTSDYLNGYSSKGQQAYFWTTTEYEYESSKALFLRLLWDADVANSYFADKFMGYSVRCFATDPVKLSDYTPTDPSELNLTVAEPGSMSSQIQPTHLEQVTKLSVKGKLDARDFATIRQFKRLQEVSFDVIEIISYKGDQGTIKGVKQYQTAEIPGYSFAGMDQLRSFVASGQITSVAANSFDACTSLTTVVLPATVTEMDGANFRGCTAIRTIQLPDALTDLGYGTFENCTSLSAIRLSDRVTEFGDNIFKGCKSLLSVPMPSALKSIGISAFEGCTALTAVSIPGSVESVGSFAFTQCTALQSVTLATGTKEIDYGAFLGCIAVQTFDLPQGFETIGAFALQGCVGLRQLSLPVSLVKIGNGAFRATNITFALSEGSLFKVVDQSLLSKDGKVFYYVPARFGGKIVIPAGVETINGAAFADCKGLTKAELPASIKEIKVAAFENTSLYEMAVHVLDPKAITLGEDVFGRIDLSRCLLYVPDESLSLYGGMDPWKQFKLAKMSTPVQRIERIDPMVTVTTDGVMSVLVDARLVGAEVRIIDMTGMSRVLTQMDTTQKRIDTRHLPAGIYIVRIGSSYSTKVSLP